MGQITAYSTTKMQEIVDQTIQGASLVTGGGGERFLHKIQYDTTDINLGDVKGPKGPTGDIGGGYTQVDMENAIAGAFTRTSWVDLTPYLGEDWAAPTGLYQAPRYRIFGNVVEIDGAARFIGTSVNQGSNFTTALPVEMIPNGSPTYPGATFLGMRNNAEPVQFWILNTDKGNSNTGTLSMVGGSNQPNIVTNDWISFCGCSYDLTVP